MCKAHYDFFPSQLNQGFILFVHFQPITGKIPTNRTCTLMFTIQLFLLFYLVQSQLFVYFQIFYSFTYKAVVCLLFGQLFVYFLTKRVCSFFTFRLKGSAVCLPFDYKVQLFVYFLPMIVSCCFKKSAICLLWLFFSCLFTSAFSHLFGYFLVLSAHCLLSHIKGELFVYFSVQKSAVCVLFTLKVQF